MSQIKDISTFVAAFKEVGAKKCSPIDYAI
jgi:hypothetical protein